MTTNAFYLALTRDDARRLFGLRSDDDLWALVRELHDSAAVQSEGRVLQCGDAWELLHEAMTAASGSTEGSAYPLDHVVLGGRQMTRDETRGRIIVKRPDSVQHIADALAKVTEQELPESRSDVRRPFESVREFYARAAEQKCAVALVIESS